MSCIIEIKSTDNTQLDRIENTLNEVVNRLTLLESKMSALDDAIVNLEATVASEVEQGKLTVAEIAELKETVAALQAAVVQLQGELEDANAPQQEAIDKINELAAKVAGILPD